MPRITVIVSAELPPGVTIEEWADYVKTEVIAGVGAKHPHDPLRRLDKSSVKVDFRLPQDNPTFLPRLIPVG